MTVAPTHTGMLFILVAPAGAGKNALMNRVIARVPGLRQLPTATTRGIREGEMEGREHLFVTESQFLDMLRQDQLLEHQVVHGRYYGVPRATVEKAMEAGEDLIADIEYLGASFIRNEYPNNVVLIFVQPPSVAALIERMRQRGDKESEIGRRLLRVPAELAFAPQCDYLIYNDDLDRAAETLYAIVVATRSKRDIMRLRQASTPPPTPFHMQAAAIVVHGDEVVYRDQPQRFPTVAVATGETPDLAALRAVRAELKIETSAEYLVHDEARDGDLLPPVSVDFVRDANGEQVTMIYVCRLPNRVDLPDGWHWIPQSQVSLPPQVQELLATSIASN